MTRPVLTPDHLHQPTSAAVRAVVRAHLRRVLKEAARAEIRLDELTGGNPEPGLGREREAVHDFRVALRRLRTWLRVWRPFLKGHIPKSAKRRLRRFARLSARARDIEVERTWLWTLVRRETGSTRRAAEQLASARDTEYVRALAALTRALVKRLAATGAAIDRKMTRARRAEERASSTTLLMAATLLGRLRVDARQVPRLFDRLRRTTSGVRAHRVRIAFRQLRYLLDDAGGAIPAARVAARRLAKVQDVLGDLHDTQTFLARVRATSVTSPEAHLQDGLVARLARDEARVRRLLADDTQARVERSLARVVAWLARHEASRRKPLSPHDGRSGRRGTKRRPSQPRGSESVC